MIESWEYVLAMKSLPSEYRALRTLAPEITRAVTPLIQLWDRSPSPGVEEEEIEEPLAGERQPGFFEQQTMWTDQAGERVWNRLHGGLFPKTMTHWPVHQGVLLDGGWLEDPTSMKLVVENGRAIGMSIVPVTGLTRPRAYDAVVAGLASPDRGGLVIRLIASDLRSGGNHLKDRLSALLRSLGGSIGTTDIIVDLGSVDQQHREREEVNAESMLRSLPAIDQWRNIAVTASGAPERVEAKRFPQGEITPYPRPEWWIWRELRSRQAEVGRTPAYGDYGTHHPARVEAVGEQTTFARIPQIRYASGDIMLLLRGHDLRTGESGEHQLRTLLTRLQAYGGWAGASYSAGDLWFEEAAAGRMNVGLWATWKWAGQVHAITHVIKQLSNLDAP